MTKWRPIFEMNAIILLVICSAQVFVRSEIKFVKLTVAFILAAACMVLEFYIFVIVMDTDDVQSQV